MKINVEREDIKQWLKQLHGVSREDHYAGLWKRVLKLSEVPTRRRRGVNLYQIDKYSKEGDNIIAGSAGHARPPDGQGARRRQDDA